jgi:hypothetical protein
VGRQVWGFWHVVYLFREGHLSNRGGQISQADARGAEHALGALGSPRSPAVGLALLITRAPKDTRGPSSGRIPSWAAGGSHPLTAP